MGLTGWVFVQPSPYRSAPDSTFTAHAIGDGYYETYEDCQAAWTSAYLQPDSDLVNVAEYTSFEEHGEKIVSDFFSLPLGTGKGNIPVTVKYNDPPAIGNSSLEVEKGVSYHD